jgi:hypothetical protein
VSGNDTPLSDLLFEIEILLSDRFPSMNPLTIRAARARDIFKMITKLNKYVKREKKEQAQKSSRKHIIKRQASDTWF